MKKSGLAPIHTHSLSTLVVVVTLFLTGCLNGQGPSAKRTRIKDFSISKEFDGCVDSNLILEPLSCSGTCPTGNHVATAEELTEFKKGLETEGSTEVLALVNNSKNICIEDVIVEKRPTNAIEIKNDFCSCINGKSDVINDCDAICASKPFKADPTLYVNTLVGPEIQLNEKLKNLANWCTVQLADDDTTPQCALQVTDGSTTANIPVSLTANSNSFTADIKTLSYDRTYIAKIVEFKTGSNAQSKEFQIRRKKQPLGDDAIGALKVTPITQYSCISYSGTQNSSGVVKRSADTFSKFYYYYPANETPAVMPPTPAGSESLTVCHDEFLHPGNDSIDYPRLEQIHMAFSMWDKADPRFAKVANKMTISKIIEDRLNSEFPNSGILTADLFYSFPWSNRPPLASSSAGSNVTVEGFVMVPFTDSVTKKSYCPTAEQLNSTNPLLSILSEYVADTEGLFVTEKEAEIVFINGQPQVVYGTMFTTESVLKKYGFYVENGLRIKADAAAMNSKTIHFYWPTSTTADPLTAGGRKLFTVRTFQTLNGTSPSTPPTAEQTTDKRIGCVPKSSTL